MKLALFSLWKQANKKMTIVYTDWKIQSWQHTPASSPFYSMQILINGSSFQITTFHINEYPLNTIKESFRKNQ
jgi:hypothetical protein